MVERKSKPKHAPREKDDEDKTGFQKVKENPIIILGLVIILIIFAVWGIIALADWLSGG